MSGQESGPDPGGASNAQARWRQVEQLFHDARERPPGERNAFLANACARDPGLRREVESLLAQEDGTLFREGATPRQRLPAVSREGTRLGPYVLGPLIDEGGMGEVYRARDDRLGRNVAIKLLPSDLAHDPERLRRSEREARVLATLNHPNIAAIYGLEEGSGLTGLVLEFVPGQTLQQQLAARGTLPLDEALSIARQIASALEAAHQRGIVHRDLKPANVTITPDGIVKVLDFGLARIDAAEAGGLPDAALKTGQGAILGTPAYMSPEQARGVAADRRTDIWAFGAVLFEMLTGQRVFEGDSVTETLAAVIHHDPRLDRLPASTPGNVRATIDRCFQKDVRERARDIADVRLALDGAFGGPLDATAAVRSRASSRWIVTAAFAGALVAGAAAWVFRAPAPPSAPAMHFRVTAPEDLRFGAFFALSPDGRSLAFTTRSEDRTALWVHSFDTGRSRPLERAGQISGSVFWSPDARFIGFGSDGAIHRIALDGTPRQPIALVEDYGGADWTPDGTILYGRVRGGLMKVPAAGGAPVAVTALDAARDETGHTSPVVLPDGRRFLYFRVSRNPEHSGLFVGSLDAAPAAQSDQPVLGLRTQPLLSRSPDGAVRLLFVRDGTLMAQEFDTASMTLKGSASALAERAAGGPANYQQVSVAGDTLAFRAPDQVPGGVPAWYEGDGRRAGPVFTTPVPPVFYPQLSPDGTKLAATVDESLWVYPLDGRPPIRLTAGRSLSPRWSPDGRTIVYEQYGSVQGLQAVAADGSRAVPQPASPPGHYHAHGFTTDSAGRAGLLTVFKPPDSTGPWLLMQVPWPGTDVAARIGDIVMPDRAAAAALSPDSRWLAYITDTTGSAELWVRRYPSLEDAVRISPHGAGDPVWAKHGRALFYLEGDKLMRVRVGADTSARFAYEPPAMLLEKSFVLSPQPPSFDVSADGRLLMLDRVPAPPSAPIEVIVNWRNRADPSPGGR